MNADFVRDAVSRFGDDPAGIGHFRKVVIGLAIAGKLAGEGQPLTPAEMLDQIESEKIRLLRSGEISKPKRFAPVINDQLPEDFADTSAFASLGAVARIDQRLKIDDLALQRLIGGGAFFRSVVLTTTGATATSVMTRLLLFVLTVGPALFFEKRLPVRDGFVEDGYTANALLDLRVIRALGLSFDMRFNTMGGVGQNEYSIDGAPNTGSSRRVAFIAPSDAVGEFRLETANFDASFGRTSGATINLTTKSGTNRLRGSGFEFFRNEHLNARNYFQRSNPAKPDYRRNQLGGMVGGPLKRDHTFFFADYQRQRQSIGRTVTSNVPTLDERAGRFRQNIYDPMRTVGNVRQQFPNNTIPRSAMDPVAVALLERYPLPTNSATANNYSRTAIEIDDQDQGDVRLDHRFASGRDQVFARMTYFTGHAAPVTAFPDGSGTIVAGSVAVGPQDTTSRAFAPRSAPRRSTRRCVSTTTATGGPRRPAARVVKRWGADVSSA